MNFTVVHSLTRITQSTLAGQLSEHRILFTGIQIDWLIDDGELCEGAVLKSNVEESY